MLFTNLSSRSTFVNLLDSGLSGLRFCLDHLIFDDSNLPFDLAQGGELVEPFRISYFEFRISGLSGLSGLGQIMIKKLEEHLQRDFKSN